MKGNGKSGHTKNCRPCENMYPDFCRRQAMKILTEDFEMGKISAKMVPGILINKQKQRRKTMENKQFTKTKKNQEWDRRSKQCLYV